MPKIKVSNQQISQITTIKKRNTIYQDDQSFLKFSKSPSNHDYINEPTLIQNFLTSLVKKQKINGIEYNANIVPGSENYMPITNQRRLNSSSKKINQSFLCKSIINSTNLNYAIQSEPNQMRISLSSYFNAQMEIQEKLSDEKRYGTIAFHKFLLNFDTRRYIKTVCFTKIKQISIINKRNYLKSLQSRQHSFLDLLKQSSENIDYSHPQLYRNVRITYINKMIGLCYPQLISQQKNKLVDQNVEKFQRRSEEKMLKSINKSRQSTDSFIFNFQIHPRPKTHFQERINQNQLSLIRRNV